MAFKKKSLLFELMGLDAREDLLGLSNEEQTLQTHIKGDIAYLSFFGRDFLETKFSAFVCEGGR